MLVFCAFIAACFFINLATPDREQSERENRVLAQMPQFSADSFFSGAFMQDFESYLTDQFFARDSWVSLKTYAELALCKTDLNGVYVGSDGLLLQKFAEPEAERVAANASFIEKFAANTDVPVYFTVIPSAAAFWSDRLPAYAQNADQLALIEAICAQTPSAIFVDTAAALAPHAAEAIYYTTDHHWTSLGAYHGYVAAVDAMGLAPTDLGRPIETVENFYGTASSACGLRPGEGDTVELYVPAENAVVTIAEADGERSQGLYDESAKEKSDKYTLFFGGNYPCAVVHSNVSDGGKLLYIKDSYANACAPYFTANFSEIHMIDLRYYKKSIAEYIRENEIDTVFVAYSAANFVSDTNIMFIAR